MTPRLATLCRDHAMKRGEVSPSESCLGHLKLPGSSHKIPAVIFLRDIRSDCRVLTKLALNIVNANVGPQKDEGLRGGTRNVFNSQRETTSPPPHFGRINFQSLNSALGLSQPPFSNDGIFSATWSTRDFFRSLAWAVQSS